MKQYFQLVILLLIAVPLSGCLSSCENEVVSAVSSPSGKIKAVMFGHNCGATTGFNTQVSIVDADDKVSADGGNVMILNEMVPLKISWVSDNELSIAGWRKTRVFKQETLVRGVRIRYED